MPVASTDLVLYASASMPDTDAGVSGGAIDTLRRVDFTQLAANDDIEVVSTSASDVQNCTIEARTASGTIVSETLALTGVTAKIFAGNGVVERVVKVELASVAVGTITVRRSVAGASVRDIPVGERGFMMAFRKGASDPSSIVNYYTKLFWKNVHATLALLAATTKQNADPAARIMHLNAAAQGDAATSTTRITAPGAADTQDPDTFDDTAKAIPGTDLLAAGTIGLWLRLQLPAADAPNRTTYTPELSGQST
jgi:hypothetical protein